MSVVGINEKMGLLSEVPKPPVYLTDSAKSHFKIMAKKLIKLKRLKETYTDALEGYANAKAQWEFASRKIRELDSVQYGSGYFQEFKNNVIQNSVWVNQQNRSWKTIVECCKMFGLDPSSEKNLKTETNGNQLDAFEEMKKLLSGGSK